MKNAFYNDIHFHYGYFIYAAAVGAHFDPSWGRTIFEPILLLIRCIANPSEDDPHFSMYKFKGRLENETVLPSLITDSC